MERDYPTVSRLREMGLSTADAPDILNFRKLLRNTDFTDVMTEVMRVLEEKYSYPVDIEYNQTNLCLVRERKQHHG